MKETEAKPALRISHIFIGRKPVGNRVSYLVDPQGRALPAQWPMAWACMPRYCA